MNAVIKLVLLVSLLIGMSITLAGITNPFVDTLLAPVQTLLAAINNLRNLLGDEAIKAIFDVMIIGWTFTFAAVSYFVIKFIMHFLSR